MKIDTIIFDNDGVLLDTMPFYMDLCTRYLKGMGITPEEGLDEKCLTMSMLESSGYMQKRYNLPYTHEEVLGQMRDMACAFYKENAPLKPGVAETLAELNRRSERNIDAGGVVIAAGMAEYEEEDSLVEEVFHRADQRMYARK
ncbi:MAG: HAD family phosphatase, partial [Victivallales bacterium]|nr:HAD family phosphatase [Victivallales bacterium]